MGYDMHLETVPESLREAKETHERLYAALLDAQRDLLVRTDHHARREAAVAAVTGARERAEAAVIATAGPRPSGSWSDAAVREWEERVAADPGLVVAVAAEQAIRRELWDDPAVEAARQAWIASEDPSYFRLNVWGMGAYRDAMEAAGMVAWGGEPPEWPSADGVPTHMVRAADGTEHEEIDEESPEHAALRTASDAVRRWRAQDARGIAGWKLCSNDGWLVTAEECREALAAWEALDPAERAVIERRADGDEAPEALPEPAGTATVLTGPAPVSYWQRWLGFLRLGAGSDGFRVW